MITIIDNIAYLLDEAKRCASVTKNLVPYSGRVVVPSIVVNGGVEYVVNDILDEAFAGCAGLQAVILGEKDAADYLNGWADAMEAAYAEYLAK